MKGLYKQKFIWTDLLIVLLINAVIWGLVVLTKMDIESWYKESTITSLYSSLIGTWGALLGFIITALSILLGVKDNEFISALKGTQHFSNICYLYIDTSIWLGIATVFSIFALVFSTSIFKPVIIISCIIYLACLFRIGRCLQLLIRIIGQINKK